jgi:hypothetical protein
MPKGRTPPLCVTAATGTAHDTAQQQHSTTQVRTTHDHVTATELAGVAGRTLDTLHMLHLNTLQNLCEHTAAAWVLHMHCSLLSCPSTTGQTPSTVCSRSGSGESTGHNQQHPPCSCGLRTLTESPLRPTLFV